MESHASWLYPFAVIWTQNLLPAATIDLGPSSCPSFIFSHLDFMPTFQQNNRKSNVKCHLCQLDILLVLCCNFLLEVIWVVVVSAEYRLFCWWVPVLWWCHLAVGHLVLKKTMHFSILLLGAVLLFIVPVTEHFVISTEYYAWSALLPVYKFPFLFTLTALQIILN